MAEDTGKQDEEKFDFTREGEALGYISLDQARVLAMRTAREAPGAYGRRFRNVPMAFEVVEDNETEDHYVVTLSFRPEGAFAGTSGQEQFFIEKEGIIALRQVLTFPSRRRRLPIIPMAVGLVIVAAIAGVAAVFALGGSDGGGGGGAPLTATAITVPAPTPIPPIAPAVEPTATAAPRTTPTSLPTPAPIIQVAEKEVVEVGYSTALYLDDPGNRFKNLWEPGEVGYTVKWDVGPQPVNLKASFNSPLNIRRGDRPISFDMESDKYVYTWRPADNFWQNVSLHLVRELQTESGFRISRSATPEVLSPGRNEVLLEAAVEILRPPTIEGIPVRPIGGYLSMNGTEGALAAGMESHPVNNLKPVKVVSASGISGLNIGPNFDVGQIYKVSLRAVVENPNAFPVSYLPGVDATLEIDVETSAAPYRVSMPFANQPSADSVTVQAVGIAGETVEFQFSNPSGEKISWNFLAPRYRGISHWWQDRLSAAKLEPTPTPIVGEVVEAATPTPVPTIVPAVQPTATAFPPTRPAPGTPKRGGTLTMAMVVDNVTLDPALVQTNPAVALAPAEADIFMTQVKADIAITQAAYDNLFMIQPDLSVKPELATSWEANGDLTSYTFRLRQGVNFHHGKEFKADDVVFTYNRLLDPVLDSPARSTFEVIQNIVIIDNYTVRFDLTGPNGFFLDSLSSYQARILPSDVDVERLAEEEFGTGPFMIEEHLPGLRTVMVRNPDYWEEGKPYLDEIVILNIAEAATRAATLKSGEVDIVYDLESQSVSGIEVHPDTVVLNRSSLSWIGMPMRTDTPPFDNILLRKAIQAATDRVAINQAALLGLGQIAYDHPIHSNDPRFASQYVPPDYDIELAKSLLAQAGYPDGIEITLHTADVALGMIEMAIAFAEGAAPAGIRVNITRTSPDGYWNRVWNVEPFTVVWWSGRVNPDQALSIQYHSESNWNAPRYFNDELDALIVRARGQSLEEQKVTWAEVQRILIDDVPRLVVAYRPWLYGARKDVRGVDPHPLGWAIIQDAWLDR